MPIAIIVGVVLHEGNREERKDEEEINKSHHQVSVGNHAEA